MTEAGTLEVTTPTEREIVITRIVDAPRQLVFEACTRPELVKRWLYGPPDWPLVDCEIDLRVGGALRYVWHGPDGAVMGLSGVFREIAPPDRIVHTELFDDDWTGGETLVTWTLTERDGKTTISMTVLYSSQEARDGALKTPMAEGMSAAYDRLADLLSEMETDVSQPSGREVVITRRFNAPRELVWQAWTDPDQVGLWWGPKGFTTTIHEMEVRPGGVWRFIMHGPDGVDYPNKIVYTEVVRPERLSYSNSSDDEDESIQFQVTVTFAEQDGQTLVTMRTVFPSTEGLEKVVRDHGAIEGGRQHLARLAQHLAGRQRGTESPPSRH